ncbi:hypothetical protein VFPPC_13954 [Pochonia chlamydosporia 170]|uniref:Protein kinase domain-containing protein n=1 Tax=Pochonia chlamydosporia 170 TaxID=1380566 RepID=A0A179FIL8_METCM|nr:hypothetical protein VFPPC_13954 [Pochonia chlamydosporia 170]OAQ64859.1 hypothetical protein VFPPC_13954 [Pochonia chlamydosporia 170]
MENPWFDLYRHPKTQFNVPRKGRNGFRKRYDVYSLGVVLFEIAVWKPIHVVLGLDRKERPRSTAVNGVQSELLSHCGLSMLESEAGDAFAGTVKFYLTADEDEDETLQLEFWDKVTMAFDGMRV